MSGRRGVTGLNITVVIFLIEAVGTLNLWTTMIWRSWHGGSIDRGHAGVVGIVAAKGEEPDASIVLR